MQSKKLILLLVFLVAASMFFLLFKNRNAQDDSGGLYAPLLEIKDELTGRKLSLKDLENKVLFINFWASWCPPCKEEMPSIESLYKDLHGNGKFEMITILYKESYPYGISYIKENGYTFPVYSDNNGKTAAKFGVTGVPETYIIDKKGQLKKRVLGPAEWNSPEAKDFIHALLNE